MKRELCCHTKDGVKLQSCQAVTLYREGGHALSGSAHYFGHEDGDWRLDINGPGISTLYASRLASLHAAREALVQKLEELQTEIACYD